MAKWRPDGWINPHQGVSTTTGSFRHRQSELKEEQAYEAGADAMYEPAYQKGKADGKVLNVPAPAESFVPFPKNYPRSPLRYPGGKNRAVKEIYSCIPVSEKVLCSPFLGGASVELACSARMEVRGYDAFAPLVDFWNVLMNDPNGLADAVTRYYPLSKTKFYNLQKIYVNLENLMDRAAAFYVLNRSSFSGTTLTGGMSPDHPRFTLSSIQRLRDFDVSNFKVEKADFTESIAKNEDAFLYLDPPYLNGQTLYGLKGDMHKGFDHKTLADMLCKRGKWILSYNDCKAIREYYQGYQIFDIDWTYGMNKSKISNEVLVVSHDRQDFMQGRDP